jgi:hypothetical protein
MGDSSGKGAARGRRDRNKTSRKRGLAEGASAARDWSGSTLARISAAILLLACVAPFVLVGNQYPPEVLFYWLFGGVVIAVVFAVAATMGADRKFDIAAWASRRLTGLSPVAFALLIGVVGMGLSLFFAKFAFANSASTPDEIAQLWQAKVMLHGHLSLPVDVNREFFGLETIVDIGRWYSQFPIGGPLAMVPGAFVGAPWIVNPVLLGLAATCLYLFARRAYGETQGRAIAAVFVSAPMVLILAGTWMNHVPVLCLATLTMLLLVAWDGSASAVRSAGIAAAVGVVLGLIATIRPLDAIAVALGVAAFQVSVAIDRAEKWRDVPFQVAGGIAGALPLLLANRATTGSAFRFGYDVLWGEGHRVGFHTDPYGNTHTLQQGLGFASNYISELNMFLLAWPVPAVLIAVVTLVVMRSASRWDRLVLALLGAQLAAYAAYWGDGEFLGPRFLYTALPSLAILVARAPFVIADRFGRRIGRGAAAATLACVGIAWLVPELPFSVLGLAAQARDARQTLKVDIAGAVRDANAHNALVFLREPFTMRLTRRLWGIGMPRSDAARIIAQSDACSVLSALRAAEGDSAGSANRLAFVHSAVVTLPGPLEAAASDGRPRIRVASRKTITPQCQAEIDADRQLGVAPFGPALTLEHFGADGKIGGDVIYAADLGDRNEVLRTRFADRRWYRLTLRPERGRMRAIVTPY